MESCIASYHIKAELATCDKNDRSNVVDTWEHIYSYVPGLDGYTFKDIQRAVSEKVNEMDWTKHRPDLTLTLGKLNIEEGYKFEPLKDSDFPPDGHIWQGQAKRRVTA